MKYLFFIIGIFSCLSLFGQLSSGTIQLHLTINNQAIEISSYYPFLDKGDSIKIEVFKFYLSDVQLLQGDKIVGKGTKKHILIDAENSTSCQVGFESTASFNKIQFAIGVDSTTNVSGVFGGDLDPTNGMYWSWQSGYINFKLEGVTSKCPARKNRFVYHLGGYQSPNNSLQTVVLPVTTNDSIHIDIALEQLLEQIDWEENYHIMSPGQRAIEMSKLFRYSFKATL